MRKLTPRAILVTCLVAFIAVLVTALVAVPLALQATRKATRDGLSSQADLAALLVNMRPRPAGEDQLAQRLRQRGFQLYLISNGTLVTTGSVPQRLVTAIADGRMVQN